jgi:HD superfamily phosphohydrolase
MASAWQEAEEQLRREVDEYVAWAFRDYRFEKPRGWKIIQDVLGGASRFEPWEVAIIDTPVVQRLRRIGQTGLSSLLYPSAHATRFEHSLGVAVEAAKIMHAVNARVPSEAASTGVQAPFSKAWQVNARAAALLHDTGHGPFSHCCEYSWLDAYDSIYELSKGDKSPYLNRRPHEILSAYIVQTPTMAEFFRQLTPEYNVTIDPDTVARMILNRPKEDESHLAYAYQVVNGPFDADKLDYIRRDSYVTGLQMALEVDRLVHSLEKGSNGEADQPSQVILVGTGGVPAVEQILFSKMLLTTALYHHHKIRAIEAMIAAAFRRTRPDGSDPFGRPMRSPVDFLYLDDVCVLAAPTREGLPDSLLRDVLDRRLVKRALTVSRGVLARSEDEVRYHELVTSMMASGAAREELRTQIHQELHGRDARLNEEEEARVLVDFPVPPSFSEAVATYVERENGEPTHLEDFFSMDSWVNAYREFFYQGRIYATPAKRVQVGVAAREVLKRDYGVELKDMAHDTCKYNREDDWRRVRHELYGN